MNRTKKVVSAMMMWEKFNEIYPIYARHITDPYSAMSYSRKSIRGRYYAAEQQIMKDPVCNAWYAIHVMKRRWPEAEPYMVYPHQMYLYAKKVIKGRWIEAEPRIMNDPVAAYRYALDVIKGRWIEAEPAILRDPIIACLYACRVLKRRWPEAEAEIKQHQNLWDQYATRFKIP